MVEDLSPEEISGMNKHFQQSYFTMMLSTLSLVQQIPQETKHRDNISGSTLNNKAQKFTIPDVLVNSPSRCTQSLN